MLKKLKLGDKVQLIHTSMSPLGGWLHGENAVVCGLTKTGIKVKLCDKVLAKALQQGANDSKSLENGLVVQLENLVSWVAN